MNSIANYIVKEETSKEITDAIKQEKIDYVSRNDCEYRRSCGFCKECKAKEPCDKKACENCENCKENFLHAEMKIINKLYKRGDKLTDDYIGISKLTCAPCQLTINVLNFIDQK